MTCSNSTLYFFTHPTCGLNPSSIITHLYHRSAQVISTLAQASFQFLNTYGTALSHILADKAKRIFTYNNMKKTWDFSSEKMTFAAHAIHHGSKRFAVYATPVAKQILHYGAIITKKSIDSLGKAFHSSYATALKGNICKIHPLVKKILCR